MTTETLTTSAPIESSISSESGSESTESTLQNSTTDGGEGQSDLSSNVEGQIDQFQDDIQAAKDAGATKQEIKEMIEEFEIKVNGKTYKEKINLSDKDAIRTALQKARAFNEVSNEYSTVKKNLNSKVESWKKDPKAIFDDLELDRKAIMDAWVKEELEELELDPKDKALRDAQRKLQEFEEREKTLKEQQEQVARERADAEALDYLRAEINEALSQHSFLKPSEDTEREVADMMASLSAKNPNITAKEALPYVEREAIRRLNTYINMIPDDMVEKVLEKASIEKVGKKYSKPVAQPKPKAVPTPTSKAVTPTTSSVEGKKAQEENKPKKSFNDVWSSR